MKRKLDFTVFSLKKLSIYLLFFSLTPKTVNKQLNKIFKIKIKE